MWSGQSISTNNAVTHGDIHPKIKAGPAKPCRITPTRFALPDPARLDVVRASCQSLPRLRVASAEHGPHQAAFAPRNSIPHPIFFLAYPPTSAIRNPQSEIRNRQSSFTCGLTIL